MDIGQSTEHKVTDHCKVMTTNESIRATKLQQLAKETDFCIRLISSKTL
jgi:hypothetical protein